MNEQVTPETRHLLAREALLDVEHLQNDYYPPINNANRARALLSALWESVENDDESDDPRNDEDVINVLMEYVAAEHDCSGRGDYAPMSAVEWLACGCGQRRCNRFVDSDEICDNCDSYRGGCCDCIRCPNCGDVVEGYCTDCDRCEDCECNCTRCDHCGERTDHLCDDCCRCDDCCGCSNGLEERDEGQPWFAATLKERRRFRSARTCGVEWEFNGCDGSSDDVMDWSDRYRGGIHTDGSCGWEAVTAPMAGDHIERILTSLGEAFRSSRAKANDSCGIHVHVDARDLMWSDMEKLLRLFSHIEPVMFALGGQNRQGNHYCARSGEVFRNVLLSADRKGAILSLVENGSHVSALRGREIGKRRISKKAGGRYRSLNICPWLARMRYGKDRVPDCTVEFRLHKNTLDAKRVIGWTQLCVRIVDFVARASASEVDAVCRMSALRALVAVAPESKDWIVARLREWRKATSRYTGVRRRIAVRAGAWLLTG